MTCDLRLKFALATLWLLSSVMPVQANRIVADLSQSNVSITSRFHGTDLLLFGAVNGLDGDDIIVIISGPPTDIAHRRKGYRAGIWINVATYVWKNAPSLYQILASKPLLEITTPETLARLQIEPSNLQLKVAPEKHKSTMNTLNTEELSISLARNMAATGLWPDGLGKVTLNAGLLFRANVNLPANILSGTYNVRILQFRDGTVVGQTKTNIYVEKAGVSAVIYDFAHNHSLLYGLFAVAFAAASGWMAAAAFKRS